MAPSTLYPCYELGSLILGKTHLLCLPSFCSQPPLPPNAFSINLQVPKIIIHLKGPEPWSPCPKPRQSLGEKDLSFSSDYCPLPFFLTLQFTILLGMWSFPSTPRVDGVRASFSGLSAAGDEQCLQSALFQGAEALVFNLCACGMFVSYLRPGIVPYLSLYPRVWYRIWLIMGVLLVLVG